MRIEICDICKEIPKLHLMLARMIKFEARDDLFGKPREVVNICDRCWDRIFNSNTPTL